VTRHATARRRAATVAGGAAALMLAISGTAISGTAFADPAPIGNAHFTRAGAPLFAHPIPGAPAVFFNQYPGAPVAVVCTTGPLVQVEGFFDLTDGENVVTRRPQTADVQAPAGIDAC
jgi:hypothetical protein